MRNRLCYGLTLLTETLTFAGCVYMVAFLQDGSQVNATIPSRLPALFCVGLLSLAVVTSFIPNNACSRTARRDEVVARAMKTAVAFCVLVLAVFTERTSLQFYACLLFCLALTLERLVLNSLFIHYCMNHREHGVILYNGENPWQLQVLKQYTYGLKLDALEMQTAQQLEEYLIANPETESVYCISSDIQAAELENVAHICHEKGILFHVLPFSLRSLSQTMRSEHRSTVNVLSPVRPPLQNLANRAVKRLADIALSLLVLLTIFPVFALIAFICIKRQSRGPVLVTHRMCGMNGKVFQCLVFRTRHHEAAPSFLNDINDPGYFPFGKFLIHSRWEQLPQFLCVLWGSMTIVGSQTMPPERHADYRHEQSRLLASDYRLKAGITSYRFPSQAKGSTEADIWYCRNWGFWLDLRIMLKRIGTLLSKSKTKSIAYI